MRYPRNILFYWTIIHTFCTHIIYTPIILICWGVLLRENPNHKHWELEIIIPTFLYIIHCGFSSTPTSQFPYLWKVDSPNTYHTHSKCQVRFWCCWKALEEARLCRCNWTYCRIRRARQDTVPRNLVGVGAWRAIDYRLEGSGEVLHQVLWFPLR